MFHLRLFLTPFLYCWQLLSCNPVKSHIILYRDKTHAIGPRSLRAPKGTSDLKPCGACDIFLKMQEGIAFLNQIRIVWPPLSYRGPLSNKPYPFRASKAPRSAYIICATTAGASSEISQGGLRGTLVGPELMFH